MSFRTIPRGIRDQTRTANEDPHVQTFKKSRAYQDEYGTIHIDATPPTEPHYVAQAIPGGVGVQSAGEGISPGADQGAPANRFITRVRRLTAERFNGKRLQTVGDTSMVNQPAHGPVRPSLLRSNFSMRSEYLRDAQDFHGDRDIALRETAAPWSGRAMLAPHRDRLTVRPIPRSYGSMTEVVR